MSQPQPLRWTASTVIVALIVVALAWDIMGNVLIPVAIYLAAGAVLGICALFGFCLICTLVYCAGNLLVNGPGPKTKNKG
jgi:uncharacterized membrane protein